MALVEQAIFTSAETQRSAGYQLVAVSGGVSEADARELAVWGPSHDSLLDLGLDAASVNFHPLPSGTYCVSRTSAAGWEYSGRGGHRVYTHCLIVPEEVLARFANNPFAVIRAATAAGAMEVQEHFSKRLEPLMLSGRAAAIDQVLLAQLASNPGPLRLAAMVQAALESPCLAVAGRPSPGQLIAGLLSCLPPECRCAFSFSTGLKYSSRRPFRIVAVTGDRAEQRWVAHQHNVTVLDLTDPLPDDWSPADAWARLIARALSGGGISFLAGQLSKRRFDLTTKELAALGLQLLEELETSAFRGEAKPAASAVDRVPDAPALAASLPAPSAAPRRAAQRADAAHRKLQSSNPSALVADVEPAPSAIAPAAPQVLEKLEFLDDVVYEAIAGRTGALEELETLWPRLRTELGEDALAESREQYLRYALQLWEGGAESQELRNAGRAIQALDVLCVLFDEA